MNKKLSTLEIDILKNNEINLVLDNTSITVDEETFNNVNFIKMKVLTQRPINSNEDLIKFASSHPNFEVIVIQIDLKKLDVGIITRFNNIKISNVDDDFVDVLKKDNPVKIFLGSEKVYDDNGEYFTMELYKNYLESENTHEYIVRLLYGVYDINLTYGDVNNKNIPINFDQYYDIYITGISRNGQPYEMLSGVLECSLPKYIDDVIKLINVESVKCAFGHLL